MCINAQLFESVGMCILCTGYESVCVCCLWVKEKEIYPSFQDLGEQLLQKIKPAQDPGTEIRSDCFLFLLLFCITAPWRERADSHCPSFTGLPYISREN